MTRRTFTAGVLAAGAAYSQVPDKRRGQQLIDQCLAALGGQAFLNMQDRLEVGRAYQFYRERLSGLAVARLHTRYLEPPNPVPDLWFGMLERQVFGKKHEDAVIFNSQGGFDVTFRGVRPLPDVDVQKHREASFTNFLYFLRQRLHEPGLSFESTGVDVVDNQQVEKVDVYDSQNRKITVYLGIETHLPVMQRYFRFDNTYQDRVEEITRFSKFHDAGQGVKWPLDVQRERDGEKLYQMFSEKVSVGNNFDPQLFSLPGDMQMLKKENS